MSMRRASITSKLQKKIGVGLIGAGRIGLVHLEALVAW